MLKTKQIFEKVEYGEYNKLTHLYAKKVTPLDVLVNEFIEEEELVSDQLVDIKYSTFMLDDEISSSALIVYNK